MTKQLIENYTHEVWNKKNLAIIDDLFHEDVFIHTFLGDFKGPEAKKQIVNTWLTSFPDLSLKPNEIKARKDVVTLLWSAVGTHKGEFKGIPSSGKSVSYHGVCIYRLKAEKIIEYWTYLDMQQILDQITK